MRLKGRVTNITDYGAFVELEPGIEGLIHVSEMSWTKKNVHPGKIIATSQEVDVQVLEVDSAKRRISLGLKQTLQNPWEAFAQKHPVGSEVSGEVKNKTEFGLFIGLDGDVDGNGPSLRSRLEQAGRTGDRGLRRRGDIVRAKVLDVDIEKERISLGVKQLASDPYQAKTAGEEGGELRKGAVVTCEVIREIKEGGIEVKIAGSDLSTFIKRSSLRAIAPTRRPERFANRREGRRPHHSSSIAKRARSAVSIKALEVAEEKEAIAHYGSADSGASLGDILGAALKARDKGGKKGE